MDKGKQPQQDSQEAQEPAQQQQQQRKQPKAPPLNVQAPQHSTWQTPPPSPGAGAADQTQNNNNSPHSSSQPAESRGDLSHADALQWARSDGMVSRHADDVRARKKRESGAGCGSEPSETEVLSAALAAALVEAATTNDPVRMRYLAVANQAVHSASAARPVSPTGSGEGRGVYREGKLTVNTGADVFRSFWAVLSFDELKLFPGRSDAAEEHCLRLTFAVVESALLGELEDGAGSGDLGNCSFRLVLPGVQTYTFICDNRTSARLWVAAAAIAAANKPEGTLVSWGWLIMAVIVV